MLESLLRLLASVLAAAVVAQLRALLSAEAGGWQWQEACRFEQGTWPFFEKTDLDQPNRSFGLEKC